MSNLRVVYSSEKGRMCPECKKPIAKCRCKGRKKEASRPPTDGVVRVRREKKGRGGKTATTVSGVEGDDKALKKLAKELKGKCGVGGSVKDWVIIIQGDHVDKVVELLKAKGMNAKKAGG